MMEMMTKELKEKLLNANRNGGKTVLAHYFSLTGWDWYIVSAVEDEGELYLYGYVCGMCNEWGDVSLKELEQLNAKGIVMRDSCMMDGMTAKEYAKINGH